MGFDVYAVSLDGVVRYVGATILGIERRWKEHLRLPRRSCTALSEGIRTHGHHAFVVEHIASAIRREELKNLERILIEQHNTLSPNGYNLKTEGDKATLSEEAKRRISEAHMGKIGHKNTPETRSKISTANKGRPKSLEWRKAMTGIKRGPLSPETREKIASAHRGKVLSPEHVAKVAAANTGRKHTLETREKISVSGTGKRKPPLTAAHKAAITIALSGKTRGPMSPETKLKISNTKQKRIRAIGAHEHGHAAPTAGANELNVEL
jgi:group I intron endonuclease